MKIRHDDFTFDDHQQVTSRLPAGDGRDAAHEDRARPRGADREARSPRRLTRRIVDDLRAWLSPGTLL